MLVWYTVLFIYYYVTKGTETPDEYGTERRVSSERVALNDSRRGAMERRRGEGLR